MAWELAGYVYGSASGSASIHSGDAKPIHLTGRGVGGDVDLGAAATYPLGIYGDASVLPSLSASQEYRNVVQVGVVNFTSTTGTAGGACNVYVGAYWPHVALYLNYVGATTPVAWNAFGHALPYKMAFGAVPLTNYLSTGAEATSTLTLNGTDPTFSLATYPYVRRKDTLATLDTVNQFLSGDTIGSTLDDNDYYGAPSEYAFFMTADATATAANYAFSLSLTVWTGAELWVNTPSPDTTPPTAGTIAADVACNLVTLTVTAGSDNDGNPCGRTLYAATDRDFSSLVDGYPVTLGSDGSTVVYQALMSNHAAAYWFKVRFRDTAGNTSDSDVVEVDTEGLRGVYDAGTVALSGAYQSGTVALTGAYDAGTVTLTGVYD